MTCGPAPIPSSGILSLPPELAENLVISTAREGFPTAISALSQTCRSFRELIYSPSDQHLWRGIFLTTFDDPRALYFVDSSNFDWGHEFRQRVRAQLFLRRHVQPLRTHQVYNLRSRAAPSIVDLSLTYDTAASVQTLQTLLSVVKTSAPCSSKRGPSATSSRDKEETATSYGSTSHSRSLSYAYMHSAEFPTRADDLPGGSSLNVSWLESTLKTGLPVQLVAKISGERRDLEWDQSAEAQALGRLVTCTGFLPFRETRPDHLDSDASPSSSAAEKRASGASDPDMSIHAQTERARYRARQMVYNMSYLTRRRHWGPYLPVAPSPDEAVVKNDIPASTSDNAFYMSVTGVDPGSDSEFDPDFVPADDDSSDSSQNGDASPVDTEHVVGTVAAVSRRQRKRTLPTAEQLMPDWTWLAAARIVSDANLLQHEAHRLDDLTSWHSWRERARQSIEEKRKEAGLDTASGPSECSARSKGKGRQDTDGHDPESEVAGWDWAGVEGLWRRCVSWLGYSYLIRHNMLGSFDGHGIHEHMLVVPMHIHVVGYGPPSIPEYKDRPTILFEGETGGPEWIGAGLEEDEVDDVRKVRGYVSVVADGSVRWHINISEAENPDIDEWVSEGIHIGGVGSDAGFLGMWTGANHDSGDPLGPFWQWKVA